MNRDARQEQVLAWAKAAFTEEQATSLTRRNEAKNAAGFLVLKKWRGGGCAHGGTPSSISRPRSPHWTSVRCVSTAPAVAEHISVATAQGCGRSHWHGHVR
jgi:hypothetical protein